MFTTAIQSTAEVFTSFGGQFAKKNVGVYWSAHATATSTSAVSFADSRILLRGDFSFGRNGVTGNRIACVSVDYQLPLGSRPTGCETAYSEADAARFVSGTIGTVTVITDIVLEL